ncbi:hypothetical protein AN2V17_08940 [Vallitalea sp. AN17-2]|uniref:Uncharacterized protein n=1 Tax=Vallitalea maricola TaxID=3074433 RepID=A0ACB5UFM6_9FIRM|nr:hypothetical protein AN2V17_08940 [Vallitalea sp. AN17-2]
MTISTTFFNTKIIVLNCQYLYNNILLFTTIILTDIFRARLVLLLIKKIKDAIAGTASLILS